MTDSTMTDSTTTDPAPTFLDRALPSLPEHIRAALAQEQWLRHDSVHVHLDPCTVTGCIDPSATAVHHTRSTVRASLSVRPPGNCLSDLLLDPESSVVVPGRDAKVAIRILGRLADVEGRFEDATIFELEDFERLVEVMHRDHDRLATSFPELVDTLDVMLEDLRARVSAHVDAHGEELLELLLEAFSQPYPRALPDSVKALCTGLPSPARRGKRPDSVKAYERGMRSEHRLARVEYDSPRAVLSVDERVTINLMGAGVITDPLERVIRLMFGRPDGSLLLPPSLLGRHIRSARSVVLARDTPPEVLDTAAVLMRGGADPSHALTMATDLAIS